MHNVTELNVKTATQETLKEVNRHMSGCLEPDVDRINTDSFWLKDISKNYDLPKFFSSLTSDELTWKKDVQITGRLVSSFTDIPPEDIWDDEDALEEYMDDLHEGEIEGDYEKIMDKDLEIYYNPELVISPEVLAKLEDAKEVA